MPKRQTPATRIQFRLASLFMPKAAVLTILSCLAFVAFSNAPAFGQTLKEEPKSFPLLHWDGGVTCRAKGRLQDKDYCNSKIMDQVVAQGQNAVPMLISQLTDTRELKEPIFDF